jgi:hypothetical protein
MPGSGQTAIMITSVSDRRRHLTELLDGCLIAVLFQNALAYLGAAASVILIDNPELRSDC